MGGGRSFKGVSVNFLEAVEFLGWAAFLEHYRGGFVDRMVTGFWDTLYNEIDQKIMFARAIERSDSGLCFRVHPWARRSGADNAHGARGWSRLQRLALRTAVRARYC